ncbi:helix-turn-helix domain-containing protein [Altererythrobacter fulvus]|uniref:helix-turn-helix domain-containing protein n=1 Tax=Caenibius fulvus TaxID=2126012 RepID=UPI0030161030
MLKVFSTRAGSRLERSRQWLAFTGADRVEIDDDREASIRGSDFGPVRLCQASLGRHRIAQAPRFDREGEEAALKFFFQEEGSTRLRQHGREIEIRPGQWCALRKDLPYEFEAPGHSRQLTITLPCEALAAPRPGFQWWGLPRSYRSGAVQVLHATASAAVMTGAELSGHESDLIGRQVVQLLELAVRAGDRALPPDMKERRRAAALDFIERNLADPALGVPLIAHALGCSSRTLHKLFEGEANTVARIIWNRRLDRCRSELTDPAFAARSITEIAHYWGFSDSQHFSRAFKARFGRTPRECRALAVLH